MGSSIIPKLFWANIGNSFKNISEEGGTWSGKSLQEIGEKELDPPRGGGSS